MSAEKRGCGVNAAKIGFRVGGQTKIIPLHLYLYIIQKDDYVANCKPRENNFKKRGYVFLSLKKFHLKCAAQSLSAVVTKIPAAMAIPVPNGFHRAMHAPAPITEAQA